MSDSADTIAEDFEPLMSELGKALYICQAFEHSLCLLHALMSYEEADAEEKAFTASWDFHSSKTLGQTINALRKRIDIPNDLNFDLEEAIKCRNQIVHGFMTKNMPRLIDLKGRLETQAELIALRTKVKKRNDLINDIMDSILKKYGTSTKLLKEQSGDMYMGRNKPDIDDVH